MPTNEELMIARHTQRLLGAMMPVLLFAACEAIYKSNDTF
jgi:hypothetical protein